MLPGFGIENIGIDIGEFGPFKRTEKKFQSVVEIMVAKVSQGVIQTVHRLIGRVDFAFGVTEPYPPIPNGNFCRCGGQQI